MSTWTDVIVATVYVVIAFISGYLSGRNDERQRHHP